MYPNREVIHGALWDTLAYATGATVALRFFNAVRATIDLSNMEIAGQLPFPKAFLIRAIRFFVKHGTFSQDVAAAAAAAVGAVQNVCLLVNTCALILTIGAKNYGTYPLRLFSAGGGVAGCGMSSLSDVGPAGAPQTGSISYAQLGSMKVSDVYTLSKPLFIEPQMNFNVDLLWGAAVATVGNPNISVVLEGDLIRAVQ